jgi:hypothetical protein
MSTLTALIAKCEHRLILGGSRSVKSPGAAKGKTFALNIPLPKALRPVFSLKENRAKSTKDFATDRAA